MYKGTSRCPLEELIEVSIDKLCCPYIDSPPGQLYQCDGSFFADCRQNVVNDKVKDVVKDNFKKWQRW